MIYIRLSDDLNYDAFISYVLKECDEVSFHFPILDEKEYSIPELAQDFVRYKRAQQEFLEELFKNGAIQKTSKKYNDISLGYETKIIRVKLYQKLIERIKKHHLYDWVWWNALPEDPCFYSNNECRFITISHEELFCICNEKKDSLLLNKANEQH